jgi:hypothetical protein
MAIAKFLIDENERRTQRLAEVAVTDSRRARSQPTLDAPPANFARGPGDESGIRTTSGWRPLATREGAPPDAPAHAPLLVARCPVNASHRFTATSTYFGSRSMPWHVRPGARRRSGDGVRGCRG